MIEVVTALDSILDCGCVCSDQSGDKLCFYCRASLMDEGHADDCAYVRGMQAAVRPIPADEAGPPITQPA